MKKAILYSAALALLTLCGCSDKDESSSWQKLCGSLRELCRGKKDEPAKYEVKSFDGVPFIAENSKPVLGRMFYGAFPGEKRKTVGTRYWTNVPVEFDTPPNSESCSVRMSFETNVKEVRIYSILLTDLADKSVAELCTASQSKSLKSDGRKFSLRAEDGVLVLTKDNSPETGVVNFYINGIKLKKGAKYKLDFTLKYDVEGWFDAVVFNGGGIIAATAEPTFGRQVELAGKVGVNFVTAGFPSAWNDAGLSRLEKYADKFFADMLAANPNAKVLARIGADAPDSWLDANPDSEMRDFDGKNTVRMSRDANPRPQRFAAVSSLQYRKAAAEALGRTIDLLEKKYGAHMAGYHPCGANTGEWFYAQSPTERLSGYDASTLKAWRAWLRNKYKSADKLRAVWKNPSASFAGAEVPSAEERKSAGFLVNPETRRNVIDFNLFLQDEMADTILTFARTVRERAPKRLSATFYGYGFEFGAVFNGPAVTGHYALRKILNSPDVDIVAGPVSYVDRGKGGSKSAMGASESCALSGKIWCDEDDNRTYLVWKSGSPKLAVDENQRTLEDSVEVMRRNLAQQTLRNHASWWMDLFGAGWYDSPELWRQMTLFKPAELDMLKNPRQYAPDVALIYDERSICCVGGPSAPTTGTLLMRSRLAMNRAGIPFGQYLLDDILDGRASPRLCTFLAAYALDKKQRAKIRAVAEKSACIWAWVPAYVDMSAGKFSLDAVKEATGFEVKLADAEMFPSATVTEDGKKAGLSNFGTAVRKISPLLSPVPQIGDVVLANYPNGEPAVVFRNGKNPSLFCGVAEIPEQLYRFMAKRAGIHVYTEQPAAVFANGAYVSVCATTAEPHTVNFPATAKIYDALTNEFLGNADNLKFDMKKGEVKLLRIGQGNADASKK